jgi:IPT/TIG domain
VKKPITAVVAVLALSVVGLAVVLAGSAQAVVSAHASAIDAPLGRTERVSRRAHRRPFFTHVLLAARRHSPGVRPFLAPTAGTRGGLHRASVSQLPGRLVGGASTRLQTSAANTGTVLERLSAFAATSFGTDSAPVAPPDTQVAAGPVYIGEAINTALVVWSRHGGLVGAADLNAFFSVPTGYGFSDPRIIYDTLSGRWFLSGLAADAAFDSNAYLAVSDSTDPTARWSIYELASYAGVVTDQPKIGVNSDKVVMSWNDFTTSGTVFGGAETWVLQKSDLLIGAGVQHVSFSPDASRFDIVPVTSLTATATEYLVYNNTCSGAAGFGVGSCTTGSSTLGVVAITGTPAGGDVAWSESDPSVVQTSNPPGAAQPSGPSIDTNDDRLLSAVWQNGTLWTTANDACLAGGVAQSCLRLVEVTTGATPSVLFDGDIGLAGADLYFPAVTLDGSGDPYVVATLSSSSIFPSVIVYGESATSSGLVGANVWNGAGPYACSFCGAGNNRWGDYSGAAIDPTNPSDVWVAGEYGTALGGDNWGTAIGELTFSGPTVTAVSPHGGSASGGTHVTINGTNFTPAAAVRFGTVAAAHVTVQSATQLVATAPAHSSGSVHVTVTTADGTSVTSNADTFTYTKTAPPPPPPPPPPRSGYWMLGADGHVYAFGNAINYGSAATFAVAIAARRDGTGYWIVDTEGTVNSFGAATYHGGRPPLQPGEQVSTISPTPSGNGYWLFTNRGRAFPYGDAHSYGDMTGVALNGPVIASAGTPTGHGYYMVGSDGGVFSFGDARFHGSTGGTRLNRPVVGISPTPDNRGYWLVATDGGVFAFDAPFRGSMGSVKLNRPVNGLVAYGNGYLMVASDGGIFDFSNKPFGGSLANNPPAAPIIGLTAFTMG